jgi:hypothetical protein
MTTRHRAVFIITKGNRFKFAVRIIIATGILVIFAGSILPGPASGNPNPPGISLLSPGEITLAPRQVFTSSVEVRNVSDVADTFLVAVEVPDGWTFSMVPPVANLDPGGSQIIFVSVNIPSDTAAGQYALKIFSHPIDSNGESSVIEIRVNISGITKLEIYPVHPDEVIATNGDMISQAYSIANLGNKLTSVNIGVDSFPEWPYTIDPSEMPLELEPGKASLVTVTVSVPGELNEAVTHRLNISAIVGDPIAPEYSVQANTSTRVIPGELAGSMHTMLEGDAALISSYQSDSDPAYLVSIGPLRSDSGDGRSMEIAAQNLLLDGDTSGSFVHRERIWGIYEDEENGYLRLGDLSLNLHAPLIERFFTGRVGDALIDLDDLKFRLFHSRTRGSSSRESIGLQAIIGGDESFTLRLTALRRDEDLPVYGNSGGSFQSTITGISIDGMPWENTWLTGEFGHMDSDIPGSQNAWRLAGRHYNDWLSANFEWLKAGSGYSGGWSDTEIQRAGINVNVDEDVNVWGNVNRTENNPEGNLDEEARNFRNTSYGLNWNVEGLGRLRYSQRDNTEWEVISQLFDRSVHTSSYSISRAWDNFTVAAYYQRETSDNRLSGDRETTTSPRIELATRYNRDASFRLSYSSGRQTENNSADTRRLNNLTLGSQIRFGPNVDFYSNFQWNSGGANGRRTDLWGALNWDLESDHSLQLQFRFVEGSFGDNTEVAMKYVLPVSVPSGIISNRGRIEGRIFMRENPDQGFEGVVVRLGGQTVRTGESGHFLFPSLVRGEYYLTIDESSLGTGLHPSISLPAKLEVEGSVTTEINIPIVGTSSIRGKVVMVEPSAGDEQEVVIPLAEVLIELRTDDGSDYRFTDASGEFYFTGVMPGNYEILLKPDYIPEGYEVMGWGEIPMVVGSNETIDDISFILVPIEREIVIRSSSSFVLE